MEAAFPPRDNPQNVPHTPQEHTPAPDALRDLERTSDGANDIDHVLGDTALSETTATPHIAPPEHRRARAAEAKSVGEVVDETPDGNEEQAAEHAPPSEVAKYMPGEGDQGNQGGADNPPPKEPPVSGAGDFEGNGEENNDGERQNEEHHEAPSDHIDSSQGVETVEVSDAASLKKAAYFEAQRLNPDRDPTADELEEIVTRMREKPTYCVKVLGASALDEVHKIIEGTLQKERSDTMNDESPSDLIEDAYQPDLQEILLDITQKAADNNDPEQLEACVDTLSKLPLTHEVYKAYLVGISAGNEKSFEMLSAILNSEKLQCAQKIAEREKLGPYAPQLDGPPQFRLTDVVRTCLESGIPVDNWINTYAVNDEARWEIYWETHADYYHEQPNAVDTQIQGENTSQNWFEAKAHELVDGNYSPKFVFEKTAHALHQVESPPLREKLLDGFFESTQQMPLTIETFKVLADTGQEVLKNPDPRGQEVAEHFDSVIVNCAKQLHATLGTAALNMEDAHLGWKMAFEKQRGATPNELINTLDLHIQPLLNMDIPETDPYFGDHKISSKAKISEVRDNLLARHAIQYANEGNFGDARTLLFNIGNTSTQRFGTRNCLAKAKTLEEINAVKPDELTLAVNPVLSFQFNIAEARMRNDISTLSRLGREITDLVADTGKLELDSVSVLQDVHEAIAARDPEQANKLATQILSKIQGRTQYHALARYFSDGLIRVGHAPEALRMYGELESPKHISDKLSRLWEFVKLATGREMYYKPKPVRENFLR